MRGTGAAGAARLPSRCELVDVRARAGGPARARRDARLAPADADGIALPPRAALDRLGAGVGGARRGIGAARRDVRLGDRRGRPPQRRARRAGRPAASAHTPTSPMSWREPRSGPSWRGAPRRRLRRRRGSRCATPRGSRSPSPRRRSSSSCWCCCTRTCRSATRCSTPIDSRTCWPAAITSRPSRRATIRFPTRPGSTCSRLPFAWLVRRGVADMKLLRMIVCAADALAGVLLYGMAAACSRRSTRRRAGGRALSPGPVRLRHRGRRQPDQRVRAIALGRALALVAAPSMRLEHRAHGRGAHRRAGGGVPLPHEHVRHHVSRQRHHCGHSSGGAAGQPCDRLRLPCSWRRSRLSCSRSVVYYAHFMETYRTEFARIGGETAAAAPDAGGRGIVERLASVPRYLQLYFGAPVLALAAWGGAWLWRRGRTRSREPRRRSDGS